MVEEDDIPEDEEVRSGSFDEEDEEGEGAEGEGSKGGNKKKLIMMVGALVLLLVAVGAGLYFTGILDGLLGKGEVAEAGEDGHKSAKKGGHGEDGKDVNLGFVEVPTMIVNLNTDENDVPRYLRLTVQLELKSPEDRPAVEAAIPRVVDQFQTYLRELHVKDLKGSAGIYRLQMELLWRVNQAADPVKIKDILFQEILIQ